MNTNIIYFLEKAMKMLLILSLFTLMSGCAGGYDYKYSRSALSSYSDRMVADNYCKNKVKEKVSNRVTAMTYSEMMQESETRNLIIGLEMDCMSALGWY